jgi:hypothetical protein
LTAGFGQGCNFIEPFFRELPNLGNSVDSACVSGAACPNMFFVQNGVAAALLLPLSTKKQYPVEWQGTCAVVHQWGRP